MSRTNKNRIVLRRTDGRRRARAWNVRDGDSSPTAAGKYVVGARRVFRVRQYRVTRTAVINARVAAAVRVRMI